MKLLKKELEVIIHGQSASFRIKKYLLLFFILAVVYSFKGLAFTLNFLIFLLLISIAIHLFYRWKTNAWKKEWGGWKKLK